MPKLKQLELCGTPITSDGLRHLSSLSNLEVLLLKRCEIDDDAAPELSRFSALWMLHLDDTLVTDATMNHIGSLRILRTLGLEGTKITDGALDDLLECEQLEMIYVGRTSVSEEAVSQFNDKHKNGTAIQ